jgi:hypothetical protein
LSKITKLFKNNFKKKDNIVDVVIEEVVTEDIKEIIAVLTEEVKEPVKITLPKIKDLLKAHIPKKKNAGFVL